MRCLSLVAWGGIRLQQSSLLVLALVQSVEDLNPWLHQRTMLSLCSEVGFRSTPGLRFFDDHGELVKHVDQVIADLAIHVVEEEVRQRVVIVEVSAAT